MLSVRGDGLVTMVTGQASPHIGKVIVHSLHAYCAQFTTRTTLETVSAPPAVPGLAQLLTCARDAEAMSYYSYSPSQTFTCESDRDFS